MLNTVLTEIFVRDLLKLKEEINAYSNENHIWLISDGISNSAGNLCLHLIGNLNHFIGTTIGQTGYVRERESEFTLKNIPHAMLINNIDNTITMVKMVLNKLPETNFEKPFPLIVLGKQQTTMFMLIHLTTHLSYHIGQINYHRRILDK